jgi:hypothetical protein
MAVFKITHLYDCEFAIRFSLCLRNYDCSPHGKPPSQVRVTSSFTDLEGTVSYNEHTVGRVL